MPKWLRFILSPLLVPLMLLQKLRTEHWLRVFIAKVYTPVLERAVSWRYLTFMAALAMLLATCGLPAGGRLQFTFLPKIEGDVISAQLRMPVGTAVDETEAIQTRMVQAAQEVLAEHGGDSILRGIYSTVGTATSFRGGPVGGGGSAGSHVASAQVFLVRSDQRDVLTADFTKQWRERIGEVAGAETLSFTYSIGANAGKPVDIRLSHPDNEVLEAAAGRLADELRGYGGLRDIDSGVSPGKEQLDLRLRPEGRARGLTETSLARQVRDAFFGAEALRQQRGREEIRVYVRRPLSERVSLGELERLIVQTPNGGEMPLGQAAEIDYGRAYTTIRRVDGRRVISVTSDVIAGTRQRHRGRGSTAERRDQITARRCARPQLRTRWRTERTEANTDLASQRRGARSFCDVRFAGRGFSKLLATHHHHARRNSLRTRRSHLGPRVSRFRPQHDQHDGHCRAERSGG